MAYRTLELLRSQLLLFLFCTFSHSLLRPKSSYSSGHRQLFHLSLVLLSFRTSPVSPLGNLHLHSGHRQLPLAVGVNLRLQPSSVFNVAIFHLYLGNSQNFFSDSRLLYSGHCQFYSDHRTNYRLQDEYLCMMMICFIYRMKMCKKCAEASARRYVYSSNSEQHFLSLETLSSMN